MMVKGLGAGFSSVYSHFASSAISPTASAAGSVVDGNYLPPLIQAGECVINFYNLLLPGMEEGFREALFFRLL
uniref:Conjugal transfer protein TraG n=1 Tax=Escherichia coli TaxID=562 RepID=A0A3G4RMK0_ECOLX|nr:conjugal transfer protein TraG [Escherichia coli]